MAKKLDPKESMILVINEILSAVNTQKFTPKFKEKRFEILLDFTNTISDKQLEKKIYDELIQVMLVENQGVIKNRLNRNILPLLKTTSGSKPKQFIYPSPEIIKSPAYIKDCKNHQDITDLIEKTEKEILTAPSYQDKSHKVLDRGTFAKIGARRHAHVTDNFSIVYLWDTEGKKLIFERLMDHTELDRT